MVYFRDGVLLSIGKIQDFGTFKKREFVLKTLDYYPEEIKMEFINENVGVLDKYSVGEKVTLAFTLKGNKHNGKHFVNIRAVAIGEYEGGRTEAELKTLVTMHIDVQELINAGKISDR